MVVEESIHIEFDETNQNMQESIKTGVDDEVPIGQQVDIELQNKPKKVSQLPENNQLNQKFNRLNLELV